MIRNAILPVLAALGTLGMPHAIAASARYTFDVRPGEPARVLVTLELTGLDRVRQSLRLTMPQGFAFARLPAPILDEPPVRTDGGARQNATAVQPYEWSLPIGDSDSLRIEYAVPLTHRSAPEVRGHDEYEYPYVDVDHGLLVTAVLVVEPQDVALDEIQVELKLPEKWAAITPWERVRENLYRVDRRESLLNDLIAIGDWRSEELRVGQFRCVIAVAPGQDALRRSVAQPIRRIVEAELALFGAEPRGEYLFLFGKPSNRLGSMAGSPKTCSMTLMVSADLAERGAMQLGHLIAHEFYHTWGGRPVELEGELRWAGEGVTDYYGYLVPAQLGLITWTEFGEALSKKMRACAGSPLRGASSLADAGGEAFFREHDAYNLIYDGGAVVAAWLDRRLRRLPGEKSLDGLMRSFMNQPRWRAGSQPVRADFLSSVEEYAGAEVRGELATLVAKPFAVDPVALFASVEVRVEKQRGPMPLDARANFNDLRVTAMDPEGLAYRIGVREGDEILDVNGKAVKSAAEIRGALREFDGNIVRFKVRRGDQALTLEAPVPVTDSFNVDISAWESEAPASKPAGG
ncbi:MAG: PDZ domain-containing protein [Phycisphaerae bacterium]